MSQAELPPEGPDSWETLEERRDLLEAIVEDDGPFAEDAKGLLDMLDAKQRGELD